MPTPADLYFFPLAFGLAPVLNLVLTWRTGLVFDPDVERLVKLYVPPVLAVELTVIIAALGQGRPRLALRPTSVVLAALLFIAWLTAAVAPSRGVSLAWTGVWVIHLGFGFAVARLLDAKAAARGVFAGFLVFSVLLAVRASSGPVADWSSDPPGLDQIRRYAYYAAPVAAMAMGALAMRGRGLAFLAASTAFAMIFWNGARGALIALAAAALLGAWISRDFRRSLPLILVAVATGLALSWTLESWDRIWGLNHFASAADSGRLEVWRRVVDAIRERPVFGWGEAQASRIVGWAQPHNLVLQVALAWGAVGTSLVAWLGYATFRRLAPAVCTVGELLPFGLAAFTLLVYSLVDGTLYHVLPTSLFALSLGVIFGQSGIGAEMALQDSPSPVDAGD